MTELTPEQRTYVDCVVSVTIIYDDLALTLARLVADAWQALRPDVTPESLFADIVDSWQSYDADSWDALNRRAHRIADAGVRHVTNDPRLDIIELYRSFRHAAMVLDGKEQPMDVYDHVSVTPTDLSQP